MTGNSVQTKPVRLSVTRCLLSFMLVSLDSTGADCLLNVSVAAVSRLLPAPRPGVPDLPGTKNHTPRGESWGVIVTYVKNLLLAATGYYNRQGRRLCILSLGTNATRARCMEGACVTGWS